MTLNYFMLLVDAPDSELTTKPPLRAQINQILSLMTVILNEICIGISNGWTGPTLNHLQNSNSKRFTLTLNDASWIASIEHIGKAVGALTAAFLVNVVGRKKILAFCAILFFMTWIGVLFSYSVGFLVIIRTTYGLAFGLNDGINSIYLGENSSPHLRGILGTITITGYYISFLLQLFIATYFSYTTTAIINSLLSFTFLLAIFWMVEPVPFLIMKKKVEEAEKNFLWLEGVDSIDQVKSKFDKIKQNALNENNKTSSIRVLLTSKANYKSILIMGLVYFFTGSGGYYPIFSYGPVLFQETPFIKRHQITIYFGVFQLISGIIAPFIIQRFNRRTILLSMFLSGAILQCGNAILYFIQDNVTGVPHFAWLVFACIGLYIGANAIIFPAVFLIRSELFPLSIRAFGSCIAIVTYSAASFVTTQTFIILYTAYGMYMNFLLFCIIYLFTVILICYMVPETKDKTLIEIQEILERS